MSAEYRFPVAKWPNLMFASTEQRGPLNTGSIYSKYGKKLSFGAQAGVRLISGPLDTGFTVVYISLLLSLLAISFFRFQDIKTQSISRDSVPLIAYVLMSAILVFRSKRKCLDQNKVKFLPSTLLELNEFTKL